MLLFASDSSKDRKRNRAPQTNKSATRLAHRGHCPHGINSFCSSFQRCSAKRTIISQTIYLTKGVTSNYFSLTQDCWSTYHFQFHRRQSWGKLRRETTRWTRRLNLVQPSWRTAAFLVSTHALSRNFYWEILWIWTSKLFPLSYSKLPGVLSLAPGFQFAKNGNNGFQDQDMFRERERERERDKQTDKQKDSWFYQDRIISNT